MPEFSLSKASGLPVFDCELLNKHQVKLPIKALIDTARKSSRISYRIYSALGFDKEEIPDSDLMTTDQCKAWVLINSDKARQKKLEGVFEIFDFKDEYDLILGMDIMAAYFDLQILPSRGIFTISFKSAG